MLIEIARTASINDVQLHVAQEHIRIHVPKTQGRISTAAS